MYLYLHTYIYITQNACDKNSKNESAYYRSEMKDQSFDDLRTCICIHIYIYAHTYIYIDTYMHRYASHKI